MKPYFLYAIDNAGQILGILPAYLSRSPITGSHITSLEGGVLAESQQAVHLLLSEARRIRDHERAQYLQVRGGLVDTVQGSVTIPTVHTIIETARDVETLWSAVKAKTRWGVRKAEKQDLKIHRDDRLEGLESFYSIYAGHMKELGTPVFGISTFRAMKEYLGRDKLRLYLTTFKGQLIGGMLCIVHNRSWTDWYAIMRPSEETEFANYFLYWSVIKDASMSGAESLDLGRSSPNSNVHLFKRKWGGTDIEVPYLFYAAPRTKPRDMGLQHMKGSKGLAQRLWSHLPLEVCNFVGPRLRSNLPFI